MYFITRKFKVIIVLSFLLSLMCSGLAFATSASLSVSGNERPIPLNASATFTSYEHCDPYDPTDCWTVDSGTLYVYQDSALIGRSYGDGAAAWSTTVDGCAMSQGVHTFTARAVDS